MARGKTGGVAAISTKNTSVKKHKTGIGYIVYKAVPVTFYVDEWLPQTQEEDKKHILWRFYTDENVLKEEVMDGEKHTIDFKQLGLHLFGSKKPMELTVRLHGQDESAQCSIPIFLYCKPKITKCLWLYPDKTNTKGEVEIDKNEEVTPGKQVNLHIETEGLNKSQLIIEFLAREEKTFFSTVLLGSVDAICENGVIHISANTKLWQDEIEKTKRSFSPEIISIKIAQKEEYGKYPTLKEREENNVYITNGIKLPTIKLAETPYEHQLNVVDKPVNTTKVKIGEADEIDIEFDQCTFSKIKIDYKSIDGKPLKPIFEKGVTHRPRMRKDAYFLKEEDILFDFDQYQLTPTAIQQLDGIIAYIADRGISVELKGHTDNRGSVDYNTTLANNRVKVVTDYFQSKGVKTNSKVDIQSFNESQPIYPGDDISKEEHHANRRVEVLYNAFEANSETVHFDIIAPSEQNPQNLTILVDGLSNKSCMKKGNFEHKNIMYYKMHYEGDSKEIGIEENKENKIEFPFSAAVYELSRAAFIETVGILSHAESIRYYLNKAIKHYDFHLHSCAYYSNNKIPTFRISVFPDFALVYNFRFDYDKEFYFTENTKGTLVQGNTALKNLQKDAKTIVKNLLDKIDSDEMPKDEIEFVNGVVVDLIIGFVTDKIDKFQYGVHGFQDFAGEPKAPQIVTDYSEKYRSMIEHTVAFYVTIWILIELVILFFTRGRGLSAKLKEMGKFKKLTKAFDTLKDNKLSFETPKIAETSWVGFEDTDEVGYVNYIYKYKIEADPLVSLKYKAFDIGLQSTLSKEAGKNVKEGAFDKLKKDILKSGLKKLLPLDAKLDISIEGRIAFSYETKYDYTTGYFTFIDNNKDNAVYKFSDKKDFIMGGGFKFGMVIKSEINPNLNIKCIPFIGPQKLELKAKGSIDVSAILSLEQRFVMAKRSPYMETVLVFSGLKAKVSYDIKVERNESPVFSTKSKNEETGKDKEFTILEKKEWVIKRVNL